MSHEKWKIERKGRDFTLSKFTISQDGDGYEWQDNFSDIDNLKKFIARSDKIGYSRIAVDPNSLKVIIVPKTQTLPPVMEENIKKLPESEQESLRENLKEIQEANAVKAIEEQPVIKETPQAPLPDEFKEEKSNIGIRLFQFNREENKYQYVSTYQEQEIVDSVKRYLAKYTKFEAQQEPTETQSSSIPTRQDVMLDMGKNRVKVVHDMETNKLHISTPVETHFLHAMRVQMNAEFNRELGVWVAPMPSNMPRTQIALDYLKGLQEKMDQCQQAITEAAKSIYGENTKVNPPYIKAKEEKRCTGEIIGMNEFYVAQYTGSQDGTNYVTLHQTGRFLTANEFKLDMKPDEVTQEANLSNLKRIVPLNSRHSLLYKDGKLLVQPELDLGKANDSQPAKTPVRENKNELSRGQ